MKGILIFLISAQFAYGGFEGDKNDARAAGLANALICIDGSAWALFHNAGGLAGLKKIQIGLAHSPGLYNLNELNSTAAVIGLPVSIGSFGALFRKYGFTLYTEYSLGIGYAFSLTDLHLGFNCTYHNVRIAGYGSDGAVAFSIGLLINILQELDAGIAVKNINSPKIGRSYEKMPLATVCGFSYRPVKDLSISIDIEKEENFPAEIRCGMEYLIIDLCAIRAGMGSESIHYSGGIGLHLSEFQFDYGVTVHKYLGVTHFFTITFI